MTSAEILRLFRAALLLGPICGAALWVTPGILDAYPSPAGPVRVALLPSLWGLALLIAAATAVCTASLIWLARAASRSGDPTPHTAAIDALRPLAAAGLLVLPYLPLLPDALPILTALAGPARWVVWLVIGVQTVRGAWPLVRPWQRDRSARERHVAILVVAAGLAASSLAAWRLAGTAVYPGGDEPHYLIMAQSLWRDGDLRIEDNHARAEYREYFIGEELAPHYLTRGVDGAIYSVHPIGLPLVLAPVFGAGGYPAVLALLISLASATGIAAWIWMRRLGLPSGAVAFAWLAVASSAPFLLHSFAVYPETTAALMVVLALLLCTTGSALSSGTWIGVGLAAGWLPWLSTKYAPMAMVIVLIALGRIWWDSGEAHTLRVLRDLRGGRDLRALRVSAALLAPFAASLAAWFAFFRIYWGTPSPTAPYGDQTGTNVGYLPAGAPGLAFDQEYGVLPYAPVLALAVMGLTVMWRAGARERRLAIEIAATVLALVAAVGAFHIWWGGSSPPGRPVVSALPLLAVPIAWCYARDRERPLRAAVNHLLLAWGAGTTAILVFSQQGLLINNDRDGTSNLLAHLSPLWPLTNMAPSFIAQPVPRAGLIVAVWLLLVLAAWVLLRLVRRHGQAARGSDDVARGSHGVARGFSLVGETTLKGRTTRVMPYGMDRPGGAGLAVIWTAAAVALAASVTVPRLLGPYASPPVDLASRAQIGLLDRFDASRLPSAVIFDPIRVADGSDLLARFSFVVEPPTSSVSDERMEPLLYGRRLVLPAGRYRVELTVENAGDAAVEGALALKLGRRDPPATRWEVGLSKDAPAWIQEFELGVDVGYAGFRASPEIVAARPRIRLRPLAIVDASHRARHELVAGAFFYPEASIFFLDDNVFAEPTGFWIRRGRSASFLVTRRAAEHPSPAIHLRTHCGRASNRLRIRSRGVDVEDDVALEPGQVHDIAAPAASNRALVTIGVADGFVPAELDAAATDRRDLGCWVEIPPSR